MFQPLRHAAPLFVAGCALAACTDEPREGELLVFVSGGAHVEDSIPAAAFSDGWSVTFSKFLVTFDYYIWLEDPAGAIEFSLIDPFVFDLAQPSNGLGHSFNEYSDRTVAPGTYNHVEWAIAGPRGAQGENVDQAEVEEMKRARHTVRVAGTATRGAQTITFDWGFPYGVRHDWCALGEEWVVDGNTVRVDLEVAGERLFQTDLVTENPNLAFDAIAEADGADGSTPDGVITELELERRSLWSPLTRRMTMLGGVNGRPCDDVSLTPGY